MKTLAYGLPRIGAKREYKKAIETCWKENFAPTAVRAMEETFATLQREMIQAYGLRVDEFSKSEMTPYDAMLDTAIMVGLYSPKNWREYYELCRGGEALEMTKWFNTNYHYLVPEFDGKKPENLRLAKPWALQNLKREDTPSVIGPFTFLKLSKGIDNMEVWLEALTEVYAALFSEFEWVCVHEPAFVFELSKTEIEAIERVYQRLGETGAKINLLTYYDSVDFLDRLFGLPIDAIGLDLVHGTDTLQELQRGFPKNKILVAGLVDGRNVWRTDVNAVIKTLKTLSEVAPRLVVSNAAPLSHLPLSLEGESLHPELMGRLAFAIEKLEDLQKIKKAYEGAPYEQKVVSRYGHVPAIQEKILALTDADFERAPSFEERQREQEAQFNLPLFPTTTIGSFPQTPEIRRARASFRRGTLGEEEYREFVRMTIRETVQIQEDLGLDVLVHGESERTDMVEFFAEKLEGIAFTRNGWILSYGTRGYRPPIIYGDVSRPSPMTVEEISYAQSLTSKPVKGMLTGPITILAWSFVRDDIPKHQVAYQIALALQDEVRDYEKAGIGMVQIDEPAFREMAPNKRRHWASYFEWAIKAFKLCSARASSKTQIHSHMCYSEFNDIIDRIQAMDFDVISIEATRSRGEVLGSFEESNFDRGIGIGVYDIHSPVIPSEREIAQVIERSVRVVPRRNVWINPDCGLKTRRWEEVKPALKAMVKQAQKFRESFA